MTTVTASTSLVLVTTSNLIGSTIVTFPNISTTGRIITVRDNDGFANSSNYIVLRATSGASFGGVSGSLLINQPFGFITLMSQASGAYSVLNTFAFPTGSTAAFVSNITATNLATLSTMQLQDRATSNAATMYVSGGQILLNENFIGQITSNQLQSTVTHLGSLGYLSTVPLFASTQIISSLQTNFLSAGTLTVGVFNPANITTTTLTATTVGATTGNFRTVSTGALIVSSIQYRSQTLAIGSNAGVNQQQHAIAIGTQAASIGTAQGGGAIAIGNLAGRETQGAASIAIGSNAGADTQASESVAIGSNAGNSVQRSGAVAIGAAAGRQTQGTNAVAIGASAGDQTQGSGAVAIGNSAGGFNQTAESVAVGAFAGSGTQGYRAVAMGYFAGNTTQGQQTVAIGNQAGYATQSQYSVAVGAYAGYGTQGQNAVAIGAFAGQDKQSTNTIVLNATGLSLNTPLSNATFIKPIRQDLSLNTTKGQLYYTSTTGELTYGPTLISTFSTVTTTNLNVLSNTPLGDSLTQIAYDAGGYASIEHKGPRGAYMDFGTTTRDYDFRIAYYPSTAGHAVITTKSDSSASTIALMPKEGTGRVGINTTSPNGALDVSGTIFATGYIMSSVATARIIGSGGDVYFQVASNTTSGSASKLHFATYQTTITTMTVDTFNSRVGITNTSPSYTLDVAGSNRISQFPTATATSVETLRVENTAGGRSFRFLTNVTNGAYGGLSAAGDMAIVFSEGAQDTGNMWIGPHTAGTKGIKIMANGRVGINNANPGYTLEVNGGFRVTTSEEIRPLQNGNTYFYARAFDNSSTNRRLVIGNYNAVHGSGQLTINEGGGGAVGIWTSDPQYALDVNGNARIGQARISVGSPNQGFALTWNQIQAGSINGQTEFISGRGSGTEGGFDFFTNVADNTNATASDLAMRITGTKRVGINTASPAYTLDVNGTVRQQGMTSVSGVVFLNNGTGGSVVFTAAKRGVLMLSVQSENGGWKYDMAGISYNSGSATWTVNYPTALGSAPTWTVTATAGGITFAPYNNTGTNQNIYYSISWITSYT